MKKIISLAIISSTFICSADVPPLLEARAGYFFFNNTKLNKSYNKGGFDVQVCGSVPIWRCINIFAGFEHLERYGKSSESDDIKLLETNLSLGVKPVFTLTDQIHLYFTLGPKYFFANAHSTSPFIDKMNNNGIGGFLDAGVLFILDHDVTLDLFGEWSFKQMKFKSSMPNITTNKMEIGGFVFGIGAGYSF